MPRSLFIAVMVLFTFEATTLAENEYISRDGKYKLVFPEKPKESTEELISAIGTSILHTAVFKASINKIMFGSYHDYPGDLSDVKPHEALSKLRDRAKGHAEIIGEREISWGAEKIPGREFYFKKGSFHARYRIFIKGKRIYQVAIYSTNEEETKGRQADSFFDSFDITK